MANRLQRLMVNGWGAVEQSPKGEYPTLASWTLLTIAISELRCLKYRRIHCHANHAVG